VVKSIVPPYHWKHRLTLFLMVRGVVVVDRWFVVGDYFFLFISQF
jgi:hypothetical protein